MRSKLVVALILMLAVVGGTHAVEKDRKALPANAVLIGEATVNTARVMLSLVDVETSELVLAIYGFRGELEEVVRTGITIDLPKQARMVHGAP